MYTYWFPNINKSNSNIYSSVILLLTKLLNINKNDRTFNMLYVYLYKVYH